MANHQNKKFGGRNQYHAELQLNFNGEGGNAVYIEYKASTGKRFNASLACAMDTGTLEANDGTGHFIESALLDDIEAWAIENGY